MPSTYTFVSTLDIDVLLERLVYISGKSKPHLIRLLLYKHLPQTICNYEDYGSAYSPEELAALPKCEHDLEF